MLVFQTTIANLQALVSNITITICYILAAKSKKLTQTCELRSLAGWGLFHFGT
jgi:hypothetical protein